MSLSVASGTAGPRALPKVSTHSTCALWLAERTSVMFWLMEAMAGALQLASVERHGLQIAKSKKATAKCE